MSHPEDPRDQRLETLLRSRSFEAASPDLVQRIVSSAARRRPSPALSLRQWVQQLFDEYRLPRPGYVLAGTLLFGFIVGLGAPLVVESSDESDTVYVQSFLYGEEDPS